MTENTLRARLARPPILIAPGVYDPLTALIAEQAGLDTLYVSGAGIAHTQPGRPGVGRGAGEGRKEQGGARCTPRPRTLGDRSNRRNSGGGLRARHRTCRK